MFVEGGGVIMVIEVLVEKEIFGVGDDRVDLVGLRFLV